MKKKRPMIKKMKCKIMIALMGILLKAFTACAEDNFRAERFAIDFNLPTLAEEHLRHHILDRMPDGAQARKLLAEIYYLKRDFSAMSHMLNLIPKTSENAYLYALNLWYTEKRIQWTPLLFHKQSHITGQVLAYYNTILYEPINSIRWAHFWQKMKMLLGKNLDAFYSLALEIKFSMFPASIKSCTDMKMLIPMLYTQKRFKELLEVLQQNWITAENKDKVCYFIWLLRTKHALGISIENDIANSVGFIAEQPFEIVNALFEEWLSMVPTSETRVTGLQHFYKIYKKKGLLWHGQYLKLLQVNCFIDMQNFKKAKKWLDANITKIDQKLQSFAYELYAKYALYQTPINYRSVADYLHEAKKLSENITQKLFYTRLQAECYCLCGAYDRAYYTYQEVLPKAERHPIGPALAEEWILCGLLCDENREELEEQFRFCRQFDFLTQRKEHELYFTFLDHLLQKERFEEVIPLLQTATFEDEDLANGAKLLLAQGYFHVGKFNEALTLFRTICSSKLKIKEQKAYFLWQAYILEALQRYDEASFSLEQLRKQALPDEDVFAQGKLLQAKIASENHQYLFAKTILWECIPQVDPKWTPLFIFQSGCYIEQAGSEYQEEAIALFQKLYDQYPQHPLAKDGRIKQGILLMNLNQMQLAHAVLTELLPSLKDVQAIWCRYLILKCDRMSHVSTNQIKNELELLLQNTIPTSLRLEIVLQLALIYKEDGEINRLQKLIWDETYPLLCNDDNKIFSVNEVYWLERCLLTLAQNTADKNTAKQIYRLIMDAQLPIASLVKQFVENE